VGAEAIHEHSEEAPPSVRRCLCAVTTKRTSEKGMAVNVCTIVLQKEKKGMEISKKKLRDIKEEVANKAHEELLTVATTTPQSNKRKDTRTLKKTPYGSL